MEGLEDFLKSAGLDGADLEEVTQAYQFIEELRKDKEKFKVFTQGLDSQIKRVPMSEQKDSVRRNMVALTILTSGIQGIFEHSATAQQQIMLASLVSKIFLIGLAEGYASDEIPDAFKGL